MAGRGRGVKTGSLTQEQLQTLGCVGKDMPQVAQAPPPTYPPLMSKPVTLEVRLQAKSIHTYNLNLWIDITYLYVDDSITKLSNTLERRLP